MDGTAWNTRRITVTLADRGELLTGAVLIVLGFAMPALLTVQNFEILNHLSRALARQDSISLMAAAVSLVALNTLRAVPHYVGTFMVAESLEFRFGRWNLWSANALLVVGLLEGTYWGIEALHGIHYDFGLPALMVSGLVILIDLLDYKYIARAKKSLLIFTGLAACQFLDVMPAASQLMLPAGRGETSTNIKLAGNVLGLSSTLNIMGAVGFLLLAGISVLLFVILRDENRLREMVALREQNEAIRTKARLEEMQNRTYREMQHLVHDLKSPLTVVQTLMGAVKFSCDQAGMGEEAALLRRAENAVDQMSQMISEILYEEKTSLTTVEAVLNRVLSQLSIEDYASELLVQTQSPEAEIQVNCVLFPRALVNLVQNAAQAIPEGRKPRIVLRTDCDGEWVRFQVMDNGKGISREKQREIWNRGYSGKDSTGLGLSFVRNVVERSNGRIELNSRVGEGTVIALWIPKEGEKDGSEPEDDDFMH